MRDINISEKICISKEVETNFRIADFLFESYKNSEKDNLVIINIGTDIVIGDSFAPFLGSELQEENMYCKVYGTLENPIHFKNLEEKTKEIIESNPNSFILGIDAAVDNINKIGDLYVVNEPLYPAKSLDKKSEPIGDSSILCVVANCNGYIPDILREVRLGFIRKLVMKLKPEILLLDSMIFEYNKLHYTENKIS